MTMFEAKTVCHAYDKVGSLSTQSGGQHREDRTALQLTKRRYKREWVKFAKPCREREDNSKRNPIAKVSHIDRSRVSLRIKDDIGIPPSNM